MMNVNLGDSQQPRQRADSDVCNAEGVPSMLQAGETTEYSQLDDGAAYVLGTSFGGVPTTPDPNTSAAKTSRYEWELYRDAYRCIS